MFVVVVSTCDDRITCVIQAYMLMQLEKLYCEEVVGKALGSFVLIL